MAEELLRERLFDVLFAASRRSAAQAGDPQPRCAARRDPLLALELNRIVVASMGGCSTAPVSRRPVARGLPCPRARARLGACQARLAGRRDPGWPDDGGARQAAAEAERTVVRLDASGVLRAMQTFRPEHRRRPRRRMATSPKVTRHEQRLQARGSPSTIFSRSMSGSARIVEAAPFPEARKPALSSSSISVRQSG